ncbi:hypothetical protein GCM10008931_44480 [Oceanobacillus oncorhynchi subsp. oncorhynchi]|uniref:hypothetical protein n=1 Tax=Oceanobacillus oncorhynchi TaxID=545501 RepID=UPI0031E2B523
MEKYNTVELEGKHSKIILHIPKENENDDNIDEVYEAAAKLIINKNSNKTHN